jgi:hypothetical protein
MAIKTNSGEIEAPIITTLGSPIFIKILATNEIRTSIGHNSKKKFTNLIVLGFLLEL